MNSDTQKNGIIYCRVSSLEQVDGTSLESQERICREYAKREGITVSEVFIEKGESAKTAERTEFMKAVGFCSVKKNAINVFIVYKLDRFARNQSDHITIREMLKKYGTALRSVTEPINESPMGKMMEGVLSTFAEFDNNVRTERSVNGMKERLKQGVWVWQAPLGYYRPAPGANLTPDPVLAPYVRLAFEEYAKGTYTYESLASFLNSRGFRTKHGNGAIHQVVEKMLKNPLYCGIIRAWGAEYKGSYEPLISEDLFWLCQGGKQKNRMAPRKKVNADFPLRKLAICSDCGEPLTGSRSTGRMGKKYAYYHHHKQDCSKAVSIPKEAFEQLFVEYLNEITPSLEYENVFKAIVLDIWKNNYKKFDEENERITREIKVLENQRQRIFELHQSGTYSDQEFIDQKDIVNNRIAGKRLLMHDKTAEEFDMGAALEYCFTYVRDTAKKWVELGSDPEKRLRFQKLIFEENVAFMGERFGNAKLTPIYRLYEEYLRDPATLVTPRRIELRLTA